MSRNCCHDYVVYSNDLKFKHIRNIDPSRAIWYNDDVKNNYYTKNFDTLKYRLKESFNTGFEYLDLSHLNLSKIPDLTTYKYFEKLKNILYLFLNDNQIDTLENKLSDFNRLEVLDLSHNKISEIKKMPLSLRELSCHHNNLESICSHQNLEKLDCSNNSVKILGEFTKLNVLICDHNKIETLPTFPNVKHIMANHNLIVRMETQPKVVYLDISYTRMCGSMPSCDMLKHFICSSTDICNIERLTKLENLELDNTKIQHIPYISTLKNLILKIGQDIRLDEKFKVVNYVEENNHAYIEFTS